VRRTREALKAAVTLTHGMSATYRVIALQTHSSRSFFEPWWTMVRLQWAVADQVLRNCHPALLLCSGPHTGILLNCIIRPYAVVVIGTKEEEPNIEERAWSRLLEESGHQVLFPTTSAPHTKDRGIIPAICAKLQAMRPSRPRVNLHATCAALIVNCATRFTTLCRCLASRHQ
jgi:hypothetical protein